MPFFKRPVITLAMSDDLTEVQSAVVPDGFVINLWQRGFGRTVGPFYSRRDEAANASEAVDSNLYRHKSILLGPFRPRSVSR